MRRYNIDHLFTLKIRINLYVTSLFKSYVKTISLTIGITTIFF